jgi:hypothetical protein
MHALTPPVPGRIATVEAKRPIATATAAGEYLGNRGAGVPPPAADLLVKLHRHGSTLVALTPSTAQHVERRDALARRYRRQRLAVSVQLAQLQQPWKHTGVPPAQYATHCDAC